MAIFSKTARDTVLSKLPEYTQTFVKTQIYPRLLELNGWSCPISKKAYTFKLAETKTLGDICEACGKYLSFLLIGCVSIKKAMDDFSSTDFKDLSYLIKLLSIYYNLFLHFQFLKHDGGLFTGVDTRVLVCIETFKMEVLSLSYDYCEKIDWKTEEGIDDMPAFMELYMKEAQELFLRLDINDIEEIKETVFL